MLDYYVSTIDSSILSDFQFSLLSFPTKPAVFNLLNTSGYDCTWVWGVDWGKIIKHLSSLALLDVDPSEFEELSRSIERIMEMFNEIKELNIPNGVEPLYSVFFGDINLRDDVESRPIDIRELDPSGEKLEHGYVKSPRTL